MEGQEVSKHPLENCELGTPILSTLPKGPPWSALAPLGSMGCSQEVEITPSQQ